VDSRRATSKGKDGREGKERAQREGSGEGGVDIARPDL